MTEHAPQSEHASQADLTPQADNTIRVVNDTVQSPAWRDLLICLAAALVVYLSTLGNGFTYDDQIIIEGNPQIRSLALIPEIWRTHWWLDPEVDESYGIHQRTDRLYRPFSMTTFSLNYAVCGLDPLGYFLVNVLLHVFVTGLVWRFAWVLIGDRWVALVAGLLFAVHPVHSEAIAYCVGRAELISASFLLMALLVLLPRADLPDWRRGLLAAGLCTLSLFSKESAIATAPVILVLLFYRVQSLACWPKLSWWVLQVGCAAIPALIYLPARYFVLGGRLTNDGKPSFLMNPLTEAGPLGQFFGVFTIAGHYVRLLTVPIKLSSDYCYAVITDQPVMMPMTILGFAGAVVLIIALLGWLRKEIIWRQVALLATIFLASYALISNVFIHIGVAVAERLMYWPSVSIVILFAVLIVNGFRKLAAAPNTNPRLLRLMQIGGVCLLVALGLRAAVRGPEWASNETLSLADSASQPRSAKMANMVASEYYQRALRAKDSPEERQYLLAKGHEFADHALELYPTFTAAMLTKALLYFVNHERELALKYVEAAAVWDFENATTRYIYAQIRNPDRDRRLSQLQAQVEADPNRPDLILAYGEELLASEDPVPALSVADRLLKLIPDSSEAHWLRARAALACLEYDEAVKSLRRVIELEPQRWEAHTNLSYVLLWGDAWDPEGAIAHARDAIRLAPGILETHHNYAQVLISLNRNEEAIEKLEFILASPAFPHDHPLYSAIESQLNDLKRDLHR